MLSAQDKLLKLVRRSKLFVPVNREKFVEKAWTRGADVIILDLEDAIAPSDKASARKMVKDVIPVVNKGGAEVQVRFNRDYEEEDLDAIVIPGLDGLMIPKPESVEEIQRIDRLVTRLEKLYPMLHGRIAFNLADGLIRMAILLTLLFVLSQMKDIRRIFEFHGAEHKVVFNFESGQPVTVENAQRFTTFHPRCGTSFLFVVFFLAIPVYTLIPFDDFVPKLVCRVLLIPVVAGVAYELIRFAAKRRGSFLATLTAPGLWMQRITTKPPSDDQAAVAIRALEGAMELEKSQGGQLVIA